MVRCVVLVDPKYNRISLIFFVAPDNCTTLGTFEKGQMWKHKLLQTTEDKQRKDSFANYFIVFCNWSFICVSFANMGDSIFIDIIYMRHIVCFPQKVS